ncbi:MAG TPA: sialidase family protein [Ktedonobacterales bacterium]|nr:sialidase family protein [Ktedonobacterales bacterium]
MFPVARTSWRARATLGSTGGFIFSLTMAIVLAVASPGVAFANVGLTQISSDPFTSSTCTATNTTYHHTEVEPDTYSSGSTIVSAFQVARIFDGGGCAIGFATSTDNGASWTSGLLPGLTKYVASGPYDRASDAVVAYDARHNVWMISSLALSESGGVHGVAVVTNRSTDGGLTWGNPVITENTSSSPDKNWIVCDDTATSPFYGNCYTEWDDNGAGNVLRMSTSTDGGLTWGAPLSNNSGVIGGQPVVRPDGTVIVPTDNANESAVGAFHSTDGGASWSSVTTIATISHHTEAGSLRSGALPTAEIDGAGTVYVVWSDCRFERSCRANDLVISHSTNSTGTTWSSVSRIPIDAVGSNVDHFIPGLAVNKSTSGATAQLGLTYYYYPTSKCGTTCVLDVGFVSSTNGGGTWSAVTQLAGPFNVTWVANTSQGRMVGDYISTSYGSDNLAHGVFMTATAPTSGTNCGDVANNCNEPTDSPASGLAIAGGAASSAGDAVLFSGGGVNAASLWNVVDNNGIRHRD